MVAVTTTGLDSSPDVLTVLPEIQWAIAAGTANALTAAYDPAIISEPDGVIVGVRAAYANTSTAPTFALDGFTARTITKHGGSPLVAGDIAGAGHELLLRYNSTSLVWELLNPAVPDRELYKILSGSAVGQNVNTAQPWFPTGGAITLGVGTYFFEGLLYSQRSAGTTSHTTAILFGGTAVLASIGYIAMCKEGDANDLQDMSGILSALPTALTIKAASTSATENLLVRVQGSLVVSTAGTLIPQFQYSAAPGGAPTIGYGTFFRLKKVGGVSATSNGNWS